MPQRIPVETEIADLLHSVGRSIRHAAGSQFESLGITPAQARALRVLARAECPIRMSELADHLRIARRSATSVIDDLVASGRVERQVDPDDRRAVFVDLTAAGRAVLEEIEGRRRAATAELLGRLSRSERTTLRDLLRRLDEH